MGYLFTIYWMVWCILLMFCIIVYLRNEFHYSEVRRSMNAMGPLQSKWRPKGVMLTLYGFHCVHTSMNLRKNEVHFLHLHFVSASVLFNICKVCNKILQNKLRKYIINRRVWLLRSTAVSMTWLQLNVTSENQLFYLSMTWLTRYVAWTSVVQVWISLVQNRFI